MARKKFTDFNVAILFFSGRCDLSRSQGSSGNPSSSGAGSSSSAVGGGKAGAKSSSSSAALKPMLSGPDFVIQGGTSIKAYHVLNDKRHILTKDTDSNVAMYDVLKAQKTDEFGKVDFDEEIKRRHEVTNKFVKEIPTSSTFLEKNILENKMSMSKNLRILFWRLQDMEDK